MNDIPGWPWRPDLCPADLHYGEYLPGIQRGTPPKVLHVGTGLHHHIGLLFGSLRWTVVGLTVSQAEVDAFYALTNRPPSYTVTLRNIHNPAYVQMSEGIADSMSLFHLGEPGRGDYELTEREVIERALTWSREVVFYTHSAAYDRIAPLLDALCLEGKMRLSGMHKTIRAYRPTHG